MYVKYTVIWEMSAVEIFSKIKRPNICVQKTFRTCNLVGWHDPWKYFNMKILHPKEFDMKIS